jgi:hypothetical protein
MTSACRTRRNHWSWLALIWLGAFLMLGALALPAQAATRGFVAPATPGAAGLEDAADRVRTALATQGYAITNVGLSSDSGTADVVAGVIMQPASRALDAAAWQQVQAGWQALAEAYPQATWLLSGYAQRPVDTQCATRADGNGGRYLVCFLAPATNPQISAGQMGVYDTLLGRWVQRKDFAHKDFGTLTRPGVSLTPIPALALDTELPAAAPDTIQDDFSDQSAGACFLPSLDQITDHIAMRVESRRRWLTGPESAPAARWHVAPASSSEATTSPPGPLCRSYEPAFHRETLAEAQWCRRTYPAASEAQDAGEDPADDPPPIARPLLSPRTTSDTFFSLHAPSPLCTCPDPTDHLGADIDTPSPAPQYLLAWPALRVRPPPHIAISL